MRKTHVLLIYEEMLPSIRLCGHLQMEELSRRGRIEYRDRQQWQVTSSDLSWSDVIVLGRTASWFLLRITELAKKRGKRLAYILDDDLLHVPEGMNSSRYYRSSVIRGHIATQIERCDVILSPNPRLLGKVMQPHQTGVLMEEPAVILRDRAARRRKDGAVVIGFAGGLDRVGDLETMLGNTLLRVKQRFGDRVRFEFFGAVPSFAGKLDAVSLPHCDSYEEYRRRLNMREWDIGLAPMPETDFHACKHYNKFCEYAASGIAGLFSEVYPYTRIPRDQGFFAKNTEEDWERQLVWMIDHPEDVHRMGETVLETAGSTLSVSTAADQMERNWPELLTCRSPEYPWPSTEALRLQGRLVKLIETLRIYHVHIPEILLRKGRARIARKLSGKRESPEASRQ